MLTSSSAVVVTKMVAPARSRQKKKPPPNPPPYLPRFSRRDIGEGALIAAAFLAYFWVRGAVVDKPDAAYWHARHIIDAERALHIFWEGDMNRWVPHYHWLAQVLNYSYFYLHFPLIIVFGMWAYYYRRDKYTFIRDSFLASGTIALVIYWAYPVAPPRDLAALASQYDPARRRTSTASSTR